MLILALALLAATDSRAEGLRPQTEPRARQCTVVAIEAVFSPSAEAAAAPSEGQLEKLPASRTLDLVFSVRLAPPAAGRPVQFRIYTPKGHLYQELRGKPAANRRQTFEARLPVAGTDVVNHSLYGTWTVSAHVDRAAQPCSAARTFSLTP